MKKRILKKVVALSLMLIALGISSSFKAEAMTSLNCDNIVRACYIGCDNSYGGSNPNLYEWFFCIESCRELEIWCEIERNGGDGPPRA